MPYKLCIPLLIAFTLFFFPPYLCALPQQDLSAVIAKADRVIVYKGLPRNKESFEEELKSAGTVKLYDSFFYQEPLTMPQDEITRLVSLLNNFDDNFSTYRAKRCGGFHADYIVQWHAGEEVQAVLICFGCNEIRLEPSHEMYDMGAGTPQTLQYIFRSFK